MTGPTNQTGKPRNPDLYVRVRRPRVYYRFIRRRAAAFLRELWCGALALWHYAAPELAELQASGWLIAWGLILLLPGNAFDASHGYDTMRRILPEASWATIALIIGTAQMLALLDGCPCKRRLTARISSGFYLFVTVMFIYGKWPVSVAYYGGHSVAALWILWRLSERDCKPKYQSTSKPTPTKGR